MKGKVQRIADIKNMIESTGLVIVDLTYAAHIKAHVSNGKDVRLFAFPSSPSDCRGWLNKRAELRRFAKETSA